MSRTPQNLTASVTQQILQLTKRKEWATCAQTLRGCAAAGSDLRAVTALPSVLSQLLAHGHWRDVAMLQSSLFPVCEKRAAVEPVLRAWREASGDGQRAHRPRADAAASDMEAEVLRVLLDAATCAEAVAACEPSLIHAAASSIRWAADNHIPLPAPLLRQTREALHIWQVRMKTDAPTSAASPRLSTLRADIEESTALLDAWRDEEAGPSKTATTASNAVFASAAVPTYTARLADLLRGQADAASVGVRPSHDKSEAIVAEARSAFYRLCRDKEIAVLPAAMALHAYAHGYAGLSQPIAAHQLQEAAQALLSALPMAPRHAPADHVAALALLSSLRQTVEYQKEEGDVRVVAQSPPSLSRALVVGKETADLTAQWWLEEVCASIRRLLTPANREDSGVDLLWRVLCTTLAAVPKEPYTSGPRDEPSGLAISLLTDVLCDLCDCLVGSYARHQRLLPQDEAVFDVVAALLDACARGAEEITTATCSAPGRLLLVDSLTRVWTALLGRSLAARLCGDVYGRHTDLLSPFFTRASSAESVAGRRDARTRLRNEVFRRTQHFDAFMRLSAVHLGEGRTSAETLTPDATSGMHRNARVGVLLNALARDSHHQGDDGANDTGAEGDEEGEDAVLLSDHWAQPLDNAHRTGGGAVPVWRGDRTANGRALAVDADALSAWYAHLLCLLAEAARASPDEDHNAVYNSVQPVVEAATRVFTNDESACRTIVHVSHRCVTGDQRGQPRERPGQGAVDTVHAVLLALPSTSRMVPLAQRLMQLALPLTSVTGGNGQVDQMDDDALACVVVLRLAGTATLQHPRSGLSLDDKARAVRRCLHAFPAPEAEPQPAAPRRRVRVPTANEAAMLLFHCDAAAFGKQHDASKAIQSVLGAAPFLPEARHEWDDDSAEHIERSGNRSSARTRSSRTRAETTLAASTSSLDQILHILVERTQPPRWADALAVVTEASLVTGGATRSIVDPRSGTMDEREKQPIASVMAAARGAEAVALAGRIRWRGTRPHEGGLLFSRQMASELDTEPRAGHAHGELMSLANPTGTPLSTEAHDALREELRPMRARGDTKAAMAVFYRLEREGVRLSLSEMEWFAFAVKRGPLVFAVRVLAYLSDEETPRFAFNGASPRGVVSRSLGMAAVQCAANVYIRARIKAKSKAPSRQAVGKSQKEALLLTAHECRVVAAQGIRLLPRHASEDKHQHHAQNTPSTSCPSGISSRSAPSPFCSSVETSASRFLASLDAEDGGRVNQTAYAVTRAVPVVTPQNPAAVAPGVQYLQRIVKAVGILCDHNEVATRRYLLETGAFGIQCVQEAVEMLAHTVGFCVEVADRDTAIRSYRQFRETWFNAPVPLSLLISLLQLESDWAHSAGATRSVSRAESLGFDAHDNVALDDAVSTQWAATNTSRRQPRGPPGTSTTRSSAPRGPSEHISAPSPSGVASSGEKPLPSQVLALLREGMHMAIDTARIEERDRALSEGPWATPFAEFVTAACEVLFSLRLLSTGLCGTEAAATSTAATQRKRLAAVVREGEGRLPTARFAPTQSTPAPLMEDAAQREAIISLVADTLTQTRDVATVLEGTCVILGVLQQLPPLWSAASTVEGSSASLPSARQHPFPGHHTSTREQKSTAAYNACIRLVSHVGDVLHRPVAPPLYARCVTNALSPLAHHPQGKGDQPQYATLTDAAHTDILSGALADPQLCLLTGTDARAYRAVYNRIAHAIGFRAFATYTATSTDSSVDTMPVDPDPDRPCTLVARALHLREQLHQLDQRLYHTSQHAAATVTSAFVPLHVSTHMAVDAVRTTLATDFVTVRAAPHLLLAASVGSTPGSSSLTTANLDYHGLGAHVTSTTELWFDACLDAFSTCVALLTRVDAELWDAAIAAELAETHAAVVQTPEVALAQRGAIAHMTRILDESTLLPLLTDLEAWWSAVEAISVASRDTSEQSSRHDDRELSRAVTSVPWWLVSPVRRQRLLWLLTMLCRLELSRSPSRSPSTGTRLDIIAKIVEPLQRAVHQLIHVTERGEALPTVAADERLVVDTLGAFCDVRRQSPQPLMHSVTSVSPERLPVILHNALASLRRARPDKTADGKKCTATDHTDAEDETASSPGAEEPVSVLLCAAVPVLRHVEAALRRTGQACASESDARNPHKDREDRNTVEDDHGVTRAAVPPALSDEAIDDVVRAHPCAPDAPAVFLPAASDTDYLGSLPAMTCCGDWSREMVQNLRWTRVALAETAEGRLGLWRLAGSLTASEQPTPWLVLAACIVHCAPSRPRAFHFEKSPSSALSIATTDDGDVCTAGLLQLSRHHPRDWRAARYLVLYSPFEPGHTHPSADRGDRLNTGAQDDSPLAQQLAERLCVALTHIGPWPVYALYELASLLAQATTTSSPLSGVAWEEATSPSVRTAWHLLTSLSGAPTPSPTTATTADTAPHTNAAHAGAIGGEGHVQSVSCAETAALFSSHAHAQEARRQLAQLWNGRALSASPPSSPPVVVTARGCGVAPQLVTLAETVLNGESTPSPVDTAVSAFLPQRALMDDPHLRAASTSSSIIPSYAAVVEPLAASASQSRRRYSTPVPPFPTAHTAWAPAQQAQCDVMETTPELDGPRLQSPQSQFVVAKVVRQARHQEEEQRRSRVADVDSACRAQLLRFAPRARTFDTPGAALAGEVLACCRFNATAVAAAAASGASLSDPLKVTLYRLACAGDPEAFLSALQAAELFLIDGIDADKNTAGPSLPPTERVLKWIWHTSLARLTELSVHQQRLLKRSLSEVHTSLSIPAYRRILVMCEACESIVPMAADVRLEVLVHGVAAAVERHLAGKTGKDVSSAEGAVPLPSQQAREALLADESFVQRVAQQLYASTSTTTHGAGIKGALAFLLASPRYETSDNASCVFPHSPWAPALWERLLMDRARTEAHADGSPLTCVLRHPLVVSEVIRAVATGDRVMGSRWQHVGRRGRHAGGDDAHDTRFAPPPHQQAQSDRRLSLREASDAMGAYVQYGACAVAAVPHGLSTPAHSHREYDSAAWPPRHPSELYAYTPGAGLVVETFIAVLSEWGRRGRVSRAERNQEWFSVVRFVVDGIFPSAAPARAARKAPLPLNGFVPSSWRPLIGLVVDRIRLEKRETAPADYAEAVLARLSAYATAQTHIQAHLLPSRSTTTNTPPHMDAITVKSEVCLSAWSRQNWESLLPFFLRTYAVALHTTTPLGSHAAHVASVNTAWTTLLAFLALVTATGHGTVNIWSPNAVDALTALLALDPSEGDDAAREGGVKTPNGGGGIRDEHRAGHAMPRGAWLIAQVTHTCSAAAAKDTRRGSAQRNATPNRLLNARGLQRFFTGSWRRTHKPHDKRLLQWIAEHGHRRDACGPELGRVPLILVEDALVQYGALPTHATLHALLDCALHHMSADTATHDDAADGQAIRVAWSTWGLRVCTTLCPFMAMTPLLFEKILLLFACQPLAAHAVSGAGNGRHLRQYLARYPQDALLTPLSVAILARLYERSVRVTTTFSDLSPADQKRDEGDRRADYSSEQDVHSFTLLCRTVQGLLSLSSYDIAWIQAEDNQKGALCDDAVLCSVREGCIAYLVDDPHHEIVYDDMFLRVGRRLDEWLNARMRWRQAGAATSREAARSPLCFTETVCSRLADRLTALTDRSEAGSHPSSEHRRALPARGRLPPVARMMRFDDAFRLDRAVRAHPTTSDRVPTVSEVRQRFLAPLLRLAASAAVSGGVEPSSTHASPWSPAVSWARALKLLFPANVAQTGASAHDLVSSGHTAAAALCLLLCANPPHQWQAAVTLFSAVCAGSPSPSRSHTEKQPTEEDVRTGLRAGSAVKNKEPAVVAAAARDGQVPLEQTPLTLAYQLLRYLLREGRVTTMPLTVLTHLATHLRDLELTTFVIRATRDEVRERLVLVDRLAEAVARREDVTLAAAATHWSPLFRRLDAIGHQRAGQCRAVTGDAPQLTQSWQTFTTVFVTTALTERASRTAASLSPAESLVFALACGIVQRRETQPWLVHMASLAAPTRVPAVLALFADTNTHMGLRTHEMVSTEASGGKSWEEGVAQKQDQLRQIIADDVKTLSSTHTTLLTRLLVGDRSNRSAAREAARLCQLHPDLLRSAALVDACGRMREVRHFGNMTTFFTTLLTMRPAACQTPEDTAQLTQEALLAKMTTSCIMDGLQSFTCLCQEEVEAGLLTTDASWCRPAVLLMREVVTRIVWSEVLVTTPQNSEENAENARLLSVLDSALLWVGDVLLGVKGARETLAPLVLFGHPVSAEAGEVLSKLCAVVASRVTPVVSDEKTPAPLVSTRARETVLRLAAVCMAKDPDVAVPLLRMCATTPVDAQAERVWEAAASVDVYLCYAQQRALRRSALDACASNEARRTLAAHWRQNEFFKEAPMQASQNQMSEAASDILSWCAPHSFFVAATAELGHLDGVRQSHVQRLTVLITRASSTSCALPALSLRVALLQWWWWRAFDAQASLLVPLDHLPILLASVLDACELPASTEVDGPALCAHWEATRHLNALVLRIAHALKPTAGTRATLAVGCQLMSLMTVLEPLNVTLMDERMGGTAHTMNAGRQSVESLREALWFVERWTTSASVRGADERQVRADIEQSHTAALAHSTTLLEHLVHWYDLAASTRISRTAHASAAVVVRAPSMPSVAVLQQQLIPQLCCDGLALSLSSVRAAVRGALVRESHLDPHRFHLLLRGVALLDEIALVPGSNARVMQAASEESLSDALTRVQHIVKALSPYVLVRPSEASLVLLKLICIRAGGEAWQPLFAQLTGSSAVVSVRTALFSAEEERAQQDRFLRALQDRTTVSHYEVAWTIALERRQHGLRLNWPCYAAIWALATESASAPQTSPSAAEAIASRWERLEVWLHALLRDGVVIPDASTLDSLLSYLTSPVPVISGAESAYVRHLSTMLSVMPRVPNSTVVDHAPMETPSPAFVSAAVDAYACPVPSGLHHIADSERDALRRFLAWCLDFSPPVRLSATTLDKALHMLCVCRCPYSTGNAQEAACSAAALLKRALWRENNESPSSTSRSPSQWSDERARHAVHLPSSEDVLVALRLLVQQTRDGSTRLPPQSWALCIAAAGAVLYRHPERRRELEPLLLACLSGSHGLTVSERHRLALVLAEQTLWSLDLHALRRDATFKRPSWRLLPRGLLSVRAPVDKTLVAAVLRHLWREYVDWLRIGAAPQGSAYHDLLLHDVMPQTRSDNANQTPKTHAPPVIAAADEDEEDDQVLEAVLRTVSAPGHATRTARAAVPTSSVTLRLEGAARSLQALRDILLHADEVLDLQYPFEVLMEALLETGRWMEAFAWMESASLSSTLTTSQPPAPIETDAVSPLVYASLDGSNTQRLVPGDENDKRLAFPPGAVRVPSPPVRAVASQTTLEPLLLWMLVEASQVLPAIAAGGANAEADEDSAVDYGARLTQLRRRAVLQFAEAWMASQQAPADTGDGQRRPPASTSSPQLAHSLTWTLVADALSAHLDKAV